MTYFGYIASIAIGILLGLMGGGGSILTVPVLVYLFAIEPVLATSYSLFIVGTTSALGAVAYLKKGLVDIKTALIFGMPSITAVFITRAIIVPEIPKNIFMVNDFLVTKNILMMLLFALLMLLASFSMIKKTTTQIDNLVTAQKFNYPLILIGGAIEGFFTGLVGAGGGFLIIPALIFIAKMPIKQAIGTSLVIITAKSLIGFLGEKNLVDMNWHLLLSISSFAMIGLLIGTQLSKKIESEKLKPAFGWFVLLMGLYIIVKEIFLR